MQIAEKLYRSPFGRVMSSCAQFIAKAHQPFMVYGYRDPATGEFRKWTRISSNVTIMSEKKLAISDHVWVWHHTILDATEGLVIEEGAQIGAWVGIFTHGSEVAIRLLGRQFVHIPNVERNGYTRGAVKIGAYSFVGAKTVILPGVTIGKGCLLGSGALVTRNIPDYSIVLGAPAKVTGSTLDLDIKFLKEQDFFETYFDPEALSEIQRKLSED